jgi:hypothetical protein
MSSERAMPQTTYAISDEGPREEIGEALIHAHIGIRW